MMGEATITRGSVAMRSHQRLVLLSAVLVSAALVAVFFDTTASMVDTWRRSETFNHGFLVVPVVLWLIWRRRTEIASTPVEPFWPALAAVAASGFVWLLGSLAAAQVVEQFALVAMIVAAVVGILGWRLARVIAFPLGFLFFAVPFGESFVPRLIDWTADFTVLALRLSGVPVFREGNQFAIPTGRWSVVDACSGIRYLIASLTAGSLYAYLMFTATWRRVLFVAAAAIVPIVANWLRAYFIVLIGHLSENELATGVDHLIYGWIFFGFVMTILFWAGSRFRDASPASTVQRAVGVNAAVARPGAMVTAAAAAIVLSAPWAIASTMVLRGAVADVPGSLPTIRETAGWSRVDSSPPTWRPAFRGAQAEEAHVFEKDGERVAVFIAYYAGQSEGRGLVTATNVLLAPNDVDWRETSHGQTNMDWHGTAAQMRVATLASKKGEVFDVAWCYWVDGRFTASDAAAKAQLAWSRLQGRAGDSAAVFLTTMPSQQPDQPAALRRFASEMGGSVSQMLGVVRQGSKP